MPLLSPDRVTLNSVLVAEVNMRRGHNDRSECLPYPESAGCTEAAFWGSHMWACCLTYMCVGVGCWSQRGQGGGKVQTRSQKAASVLTLTKFDSVFLEARPHLEEVYWSSRSGLCIRSVLCLRDKWVSLIWLLMIWVWNSQLIQSWIKIYHKVL